MSARVLAFLLSVAAAIPAAAQFKVEPPLQPPTVGPVPVPSGSGSSGATLGALATRSVQRWRIGVIIKGAGGAYKRITATTSAPMDWPEQRVRVVAEESSPGVRITYQMLEEGARQMTILIPGLGPDDEAKGLVTFEIERVLTRPPTDTDQYHFADHHRMDRKLAAYLQPSPYIESENSEIIALSREVGASESAAWNRVETIYDWVRQKVRYEDMPLKGALKALHDGTGDCDELSALFIAICRAGKIPARTVRVPGHCYAEFYLVDKQGVGHWFPCQAAGTKAFGGMPDLRPILQKGDKVLGIVPGSNRRDRVRFIPDALSAIPAGGKPEPPKTQFVCELLKQ